MELKDRIQNYYKSEKIKVDDEFVSGVIADKDRANKLIKFFEPIEIKAIIIFTVKMKTINILQNMSLKVYQK